MNNDFSRQPLALQALQLAKAWDRPNLIKRIADLRTKDTALTHTDSMQSQFKRDVASEEGLPGTSIKLDILPGPNSPQGAGTVRLTTTQEVKASDLPAAVEVFKKGFAQRALPATLDWLYTLSRVHTQFLEQALTHRGLYADPKGFSKQLACDPKLREGFRPIQAPTDSALNPMQKAALNHLF